MQTRSFQLSQIPTADFTLAGYSVAGEESVVVVPELDVVFDIGRCPREALPVNHVLLTHGHADHSVGLLYYFSQRDFQGIAGGKALVPAKLVDPLERLICAWGRVEGHVPPYRLIGLEPGDDYEIRRNLLVRTFPTIHRHPGGSLGFSLIDVRHKLKPEYVGLEGPKLVELKQQGIEITQRTDVPMVCYLGDTAAGDYAQYPCVRDAKVLLIECTFFDDDHASRARAGKHIHIDQLAGVLESLNNEKIIITHMTRRTHMGFARKMLKKKLPRELWDKTTFLMSRQHIPNNDADA